jgi:predicted membrane chloride channel (bestrophin family)
LGPARHGERATPTARSLGDAAPKPQNPLFSLILSFRSSSLFAHPLFSLILVVRHPLVSLILAPSSSPAKQKKPQNTKKQWYRHLPEPLIFFRVFQAAFPLIVWTTTFSVAVGLYFVYLEPLGAPKIVQDRNYAPVLQVASTALALLLVFRTNSSYGRWQEGRQLFGLTLNYARNLARLGCGCVQPGPTRDAIVRLSAALAPAAASFLRQEPALLRELCGGGGGSSNGGTTTTTTPVLTPDELTFIERAAAERGVPAPITVAQHLSALFARSAVHPIDRQAAESQLSAFDIALGGCQRLAGSPLPVAYTRHTSRFLISYLMFLPLTLFPSLGWLTVLVVVLLTFFLGGIENVGVQIENPIRILPLRAFAAAYRDAALGIGAVAAQCDEWAAAAVAGSGGA